MDILFYAFPNEKTLWIEALNRAFPNAHVRFWQAGDNAPADIIIAKIPTPELLKPRENLKIYINLAAGLDAFFNVYHQTSPHFSEDIPIVRLRDAGMAEQMQDYALHAVLHFFRYFHDYDQAQRQSAWLPKAPPKKSDVNIGILGLGVLGQAVANCLSHHGFKVSGWSQTPKNLPNIESFSGQDRLPIFLSQTNMLINLLPLTPETEGILNLQTFERMPKNSFLINLARGKHLCEEDLLIALDRGYLQAARLDVTRVEPLPTDHPFWQHPKISLTPHISALTLLDESVAQIKKDVDALFNSQAPNASNPETISVHRGY